MGKFGNSRRWAPWAPGLKIWERNLEKVKLLTFFRKILDYEDILSWVDEVKRSGGGVPSVASRSPTPPLSTTVLSFTGPPILEVG